MNISELTVPIICAIVTVIWVWISYLLYTAPEMDDNGNMNGNDRLKSQIEHKNTAEEIEELRMSNLYDELSKMRKSGMSDDDIFRDIGRLRDDKEDIK